MIHAATQGSLRYSSTLGFCFSLFLIALIAARGLKAVRLARSRALAAPHLYLGECSQRAVVSSFLRCGCAQLAQGTQVGPFAQPFAYG
eukprot:COSAG01_NODE_229_length_21089_cov_575.019194_27_plen_88_part_00